MVNILGVKFKTTGNILLAPKSKVVLAYTKAVREGEARAKKILSKRTIKTI